MVDDPDRVAVFTTRAVVDVLDRAAEGHADDAEHDGGLDEDVLESWRGWLALAEARPNAQRRSSADRPGVVNKVCRLLVDAGYLTPRSDVDGGTWLARPRFRHAVATRARTPNSTSWSTVWHNATRTAHRDDWSRHAAGAAAAVAARTASRCGTRRGSLRSPGPGLHHRRRGRLPVLLSPTNTGGKSTLITLISESGRTGFAGTGGRQEPRRLPPHRRHRACRVRVGRHHHRSAHRHRHGHGMEGRAVATSPQAAIDDQRAPRVVSVPHRRALCPVSTICHSSSRAARAAFSTYLDNLTELPHPSIRPPSGCLPEPSKEWTQALEDHTSIDPVLFGYQMRMNDSEAGADKAIEGFRFTGQRGPVLHRCPQRRPRHRRLHKQARPLRRAGGQTSPAAST